MSSDQPPRPSPQQPVDPRTYFAAERTFLAWVRTGLALMGFGFVLARFGFFLRELQLNNTQAVHHSTRYSLWLGIALVALGVVVQVTAALRHVQLVRALGSGAPFTGRPSRLGILVAACLAIVGIAMAIYLLLVR